jgi:hypothetical protein
VKGLLTFFLVALASLGNVAAKTCTLDALNCEVTVPDSWKTGVVPGTDFAAYADLSSKATFYIQRYPVDRRVDIDSQRFVGVMDDMILGMGAHILGHHYVMDGGYRCLDIAFARPEQAFETTFFLKRIFLADGHVYLITIEKTNTDPTTDPDLVAIRDSFHFIAPGDPPIATALSYSMLHATIEPGESPLFVWLLYFFMLFFDMLILTAFLSPAFLLIWAGMVFYYFLNRQRYAAARTARMESEPAAAPEPEAPVAPDAPISPKPTAPPDPSIFRSAAKSPVGPGVTRVPPMRSRPPGPVS